MVFAKLLLALSANRLTQLRHTAGHDLLPGKPCPASPESSGTPGIDIVAQSFINGVVAFKVLDRPQFSALQSKLFPIYFSMQTAIPVVLALTYPGSRSVLGGSPSGIAGVLDAPNRWTALAPLATIFLTGLANMAFVGPATTKTMRDRKTQGK